MNAIEVLLSNVVVGIITFLSIQGIQFLFGTRFAMAASAAIFIGGIIFLVRT